MLKYNMQKTQAVSILKKIRKKRVLIIGDVMLDEYYWGTVDKISPEAPVPVVNVKQHTYSLGGASNVALNVQSLGAEPVLIGIIGDDVDGRLLKSIVRKKKIDDKGIFLEKGRPTVLKKRIIAHNQQVVRVDIEETSSIAKKTEDRIIDFFRGIDAPLCGVIIEDYNKGLLTKNLINEIVLYSRKKKLFVAVDPKFKHFFDYQGVSLFKPNLMEMGRVYGTSFSNNDDIIKAVRKLQRSIKTESVLLTMGEKGMVLVEKGKKPYYVKPHTLDVYDVSGAGDTVIAAVTLATVSGFELREATRFASVAAAIEVTKLGATPITSREITGFCER